jgi:hypothetical protein
VSKKLDFSLVNVHLFTTEGLLKYSTECAPNGYFSIPLYDKGSFVIRVDGPAGWTFEPQRIDVVLSDTQSSAKSARESSLQCQTVAFAHLRSASPARSLRERVAHQVRWLQRSRPRARRAHGGVRGAGTEWAGGRPCVAGERSTAGRSHLHDRVGLGRRLFAAALFPWRLRGQRRP